MERHPEGGMGVSREKDSLPIFKHGGGRTTRGFREEVAQQQQEAATFERDETSLQHDRAYEVLHTASGRKYSPISGRHRSILQELETDAQVAPVKAPAPGTVAMKQVFRTTSPTLMVARNSYADASLFFAPGHREAAYIRATRWVMVDHSCFAEVDKDQVLQEALAMLNREPSAEGSLSRTGRVTRIANRGTCRPDHGAGHV